MTLETIDTTITEGTGPMAARELGNERTRVYQDGLDVVFERVFEAPRDLVWQVYTQPAHIARWWGTHGSTTEVLAMDLRPGGSWTTSATRGSRPDRLSGRLPRGGSAEPDRPDIHGRRARLHPRPRDDDARGPRDGRSKLTERGHFGSQADIDAQVGVGMVDGALGMYDRLAAEIEAAAAG